MTRILRPLFATVSTLAVLALAPAGASALVTFDPIGNGGYTNAESVVINYSDPGGLTGANCILDGLGPVPCSNSSATLTGLSEGVHSLVVNGVVLVQGECVAWMPPDNIVCVGWSMTGVPTNGGVGFTVDRTAPVVSISNGPAEGSSSTQTSASFGINASDGTVACRLDGATVACGASADLSSLSVGTHQLVVTSTDEAGNVGTATRSFSVTAASVPPAVPKLLSVPKSVKVGAKIKLSVSCPDGCTIAVVVKRGSAKAFKGSIVVPAGATSATFSPKSSLTRSLKKALKAKKKVVAVFSLAGVSKSSRIKK